MESDEITGTGVGVNAEKLSGKIPFDLLCMGGWPVVSTIEKRGNG